MKHATRIGAAVLSLAFVGAVSAQAPAPDVTDPARNTAPSLFGTVDMNQDGRISQAEARSHSDLQASFSKLDVNGDNYLSEAEFAQWADKGHSAPRSAPVE